MRLTLVLGLILAACAAPVAPGGDAAEDDPIADGADDAMIDPRIDARQSNLGHALEGSWTIVEGPWETASFNQDETFAFYANDRLMESGEWAVEEGDLYVLPAAGGQSTYTIQERRVSGMTFSGADGALVLERIAE